MIVEDNMETITKKEIKELILERFSVLLEKGGELKDMKRIPTEDGGRGGIRLLPRPVKIPANGKKNGKNKEGRAGVSKQPAKEPVAIPMPAADSSKEEPPKKTAKKAPPPAGSEDVTTAPTADKVPIETAPPEVEDSRAQRITIDAVGSTGPGKRINMITINSSKEEMPPIKTKINPDLVHHTIAEIFKAEISSFLKSLPELDNDQKKEVRYATIDNIMNAWHTFLTGGSINKSYVLDLHNGAGAVDDDGQTAAADSHIYDAKYLTYLMFKGVIVNSDDKFKDAAGGGMLQDYIHRMLIRLSKEKEGKYNVPTSGAADFLSAWAKSTSADGLDENEVLAAKGASLRAGTDVASAAARESADAVGTK